jgi:hypothetical protein
MEDGDARHFGHAVQDRDRIEIKSLCSVLRSESDARRKLLNACVSSKENPINISSDKVGQYLITVEAEQTFSTKAILKH